MPPRGIIDKLDDGLKKQVDKRLRASVYGNLVALSLWLSETHGIKIRKSALGRYSKELQAKDRAETLAAKDLRGSLADRQPIDLLIELGTLRIREHRIIKRLEQIGYIGQDTPTSE